MPSPFFSFFILFCFLPYQLYYCVVRRSHISHPIASKVPIMGSLQTVTLKHQYRTFPILASVFPRELSVHSILPTLYSFNDLRETAFTCPFCRFNGKTEIHQKIGLLTFIASGLLCAFGCCCGCCLVPFFSNSLKDVVHKCPQCHRVSFLSFFLDFFSLEFFGIFEGFDEQYHKYL